MKKRLISIFLCAIIALGLVGCEFTDGFKAGFERGKQENKSK